MKKEFGNDEKHVNSIFYTSSRKGIICLSQVPAMIINFVVTDGGGLAVY